MIIINKSTVFDFLRDSGVTYEDLACIVADHLYDRFGRANAIEQGIIPSGFKDRTLEDLKKSLEKMGQYGVGTRERIV